MEQKIWNAAFISVFIANAVTMLGQQMMNVLVSLYADSLGASTSLVGFIASAFAYTALGFKAVSAPAIDAYSRKKLLAASIIVIASSYFLFAFSTHVALLVFARLLQGAGMAFTSTCCLAMAADALPPRKVSSGIGYFSLAQAACMAFGPMVGLSIAETWGFFVAFTIGGTLMIISAVVALLVKEKPHARRPFKISLGNMFAREAMVPTVAAGLLMIAFCNVNSFLALYAAQRGVDNIGMYFTVNAVLMLISRPLIGTLTDRYGSLKTILPSLVCFACSFAIISQADELWMFLVAAAFSAFGYGASGPMLEACCIKSVPPERRGAGSGAYFIGLDVGNLVGPVIAGSVAGAVGYQLMWIIMIIPIALTFGLLVAFRGRIAEIDAGFSSRIEIAHESSSKETDQSGNRS